MILSTRGAPAFVQGRAFRRRRPRAPASWADSRAAASLAGRRLVAGTGAQRAERSRAGGRSIDCDPAQVGRASLWSCHRSDWGCSRRKRLKYRCSMNSGSGIFHGCWQWLSSEPSLLGFRPSSRALELLCRQASAGHAGHACQAPALGRQAITSRRRRLRARRPYRLARAGCSGGSYAVVCDQRSRRPAPRRCRTGSGSHRQALRLGRGAATGRARPAIARRPACRGAYAARHQPHRQCARHHGAHAARPPRGDSRLGQPRGRRAGRASSGEDLEDLGLPRSGGRQAAAVRARDELLLLQHRLHPARPHHPARHRPLVAS